ncbi:MAG: HAD hydrolase-like protein, partial [Eubacterium sp.]|nr:HAD hydrolase-like protein [Eubacterium sp.]
MSITTVIFDMDGTVLNTLEDLSVSVNYALAKYHMPGRTPMEYRNYFGNGIRHAIRCAAPQDTSDAVIDELVSIYRDHYNKHCLDRTRPYDGILELMQQLKKSGYKMAIVS